jgi:hypothetical protein
VLLTDLPCESQLVSLTVSCQTGKSLQSTCSKHHLYHNTPFTKFLCSHVDSVSITHTFCHPNDMSLLIWILNNLDERCPMLYWQDIWISDHQTESQMVISQRDRHMQTSHIFTDPSFIFSNPSPRVPNPCSYLPIDPCSLASHKCNMCGGHVHNMYHILSA